MIEIHVRVAAWLDRVLMVTITTWHGKGPGSFAWIGNFIDGDV